MKKLQHILMIALFSLVTLNTYAQASDLFFSEYAEGSSFNKYVEISNATGADVDLSMYQIKKGTNGSDFTESITLTGTLADGAVWVVSRSDADPQILAFADELSGSVINFNGDDVMGLFKNEVLIDIIGMVGDDPGDGWEVAGVPDGTKDHTLVRKATVCDPTTDWVSAAGTNADDSQWIVYDQNYWDNLGMHSSDCGGSQNVATPVFSPPGGIYSDPFDVEITCSTPDASIYYTMDGSDPDESSTPYATAINISEATTLKARAYAPELDPSNIAQANYSFAQITEVANLTDLRDSYTGGSEVFKVTGEVFLTYQQDFRGQKYVQDASAAILIDDDPGAITSSYEIGDGITGLVGSLSEYGGMIQFLPSADPGAATSSGNQLTPAELTVAEMVSNFEDYEAQVVKIQNASFTDQGATFANGTVYEITDESKASANFRSTFYDVDYIGTMIPAGAGTIIGILNSRTDGNYISSRNQADLIWGVVGEPTNYPTDFTVTGGPLSVAMSWVDATGDIEPHGYLIQLSISDAIDLPVDGTPILDDTDLSDGYGAINVAKGVGHYTFSGLPANTMYFAKLSPYTNTGQQIDYKTDGTTPNGQASTVESSAVNILFTDFNDDWGGWTGVSVVGDQVWDRDNTYGLEGTPCAKMSGYEGAPFDNEDWLISSAIDLVDYSNETLMFYSAFAYTGPDLEVLISTDYDGSGNPNGFTWDNLTDQAQWPADGSFFEWTASGMIDISAYTNQAIYVAFKFTSTSGGSATWELDDITIAGEGEITIDPEPTNYPTAYTVSAANQTVSTSWTDATGETTPTGYVVMISDQTDITLPVDGTPIANDNDYSDGNGAINVMPGTQAAAFSGLMESTMYYTVIIPYTNSGANIDYKTDGIPPTGSATTGEGAPDILFTTFDESWESWATISVTGDQVWDRDNSYGLEGTPCARMSGYSGGAFDNEDWLISPAIDLAGTNNQSLSFYSASAYDGPALELYVSTDYDGSGNPNDFTWDNLTAQASWPATGTFFEFTSSELISLEAYAKQNIFVAFKFTSTTGGSATWEVDNIRVQGEPSSIGEYQNSLSISLYPNPGNGILYFDTKESISSIEVFNLIGMKVYEINTPGFNGQIDLTALENGIYMVRVAADEKVVSRRIIIQ